ncbi:GNAT family N-acetyltransferase [Oceanobacillus arenosus]|uniref:GNAT family N-acetyltransferase n=1 Tax=Oceanobacillus arenosus TaxID=1229153 RepID=A0A3D8PVV3_9BACI|nr:GNAT family N-acetyltransferase [Oceanobacillus arenosus]RDW20280.1 GNAT family N-acetyltransferase [Oceanobacillus arenosus]
MRIYQAAIEDIEDVSHLFNMYRVFYQQASDLEGAKAYIKERLESKDSVIFVVKDKQRYVGFTQLYPTFSSISMKKAWILNDLYVDAEARKQGIGEMLLQKAKEYAIETGAKSISLSTAPDNYSAQKLYKRNGYVRDSQFYHYELSLLPK